ncbi:MAG: 23S rRNA (pseudouridine(1915)-N(3))-methyltransferase RlmH [Ignavibacteriales bacterium]
MKFVVISVGKIKESYLKAGIKDFMDRLRPYTSIELVEGLEEKTPPNPTEAQINTVLDKEGRKILAQVREGDYFIALDSRGRSMTSETFAETIETLLPQGYSRIIFAIGGSHGFSPEVISRANLKLSLSQLTFPHQMAVLIFLEQLYRSFKIMKGEPYHK